MYRYFIFRKVLLVLYTVFLIGIPYASAQVAPGGIERMEKWHKSADSSDFIGNYHTIDLSTYQDSVFSSFLPFNGSSSLYLVLKPNFSSASSRVFFKLGDITLYDNALVHGNDSTPINFNTGIGTILTLNKIRSFREVSKEPVKLEVLDSSLFSLAELIYYPNAKKREEIQLINSYLAVKYSINISNPKDTEWGSYWASDRTYYWDINRDKYFDDCILALGRSDSQGFYQTQTFLSDNSFLQLYLDTAASKGLMPPTSLADSVFLIFSKREESTKNGNGGVIGSLLGQGSNANGLPNSKINPLGSFKLRAKYWTPYSDTLFIRLPKPSGNLVDTVFATDGIDYHYIPLLNSNNDTLTYGFPLTSIQNEIDYLFTDSINRLASKIILEKEKDNLIVNGAELYSPDDHLFLEITQFYNGTSYYQELDGNKVHFDLDDGQYGISILNEQGDLFFHDVVLVKGVSDISIKESSIRSSKGSQTESLPEILVYPNPTLIYQPMKVEIINLPCDEPAELYLIGPGGKILIMEDLDVLNGELIWTGSPIVTGLCLISIQQENRVYSRKVIIARN